MKDLLNKRVISTPLQRADGTLGPKRLAILVVVLLVAGAAIIFLVQRDLASRDTWEATVTGVAKSTVNFTLDEDSDDVDIASYPDGMVLEEGDRVLIRTDVEQGNLVLKILDE
jgi:hypothetical protein